MSTYPNLEMTQVKYYSVTQNFKISRYWVEYFSDQIITPLNNYFM